MRALGFTQEKGLLVFVGPLSLIEAPLSPELRAPGPAQLFDLRTKEVIDFVVEFQEAFVLESPLFKVGELQQTYRTDLELLDFLDSLLQRLKTLPVGLNIYFHLLNLVLN